MNIPFPPDNPCHKDCPKRSITCHIDCPDYIRFRQKRTEYLAKMQEYKQMQQVLNKPYRTHR